jgi:cell division protein FtsI/penicillin-binding protein 2
MARIATDRTRGIALLHRRLILLVALLGVPPMLLAGPLLWLTTARAEAARAEAEARLVRRSWLPTVRGRILDRKGRVLAQDRPSYDIAVDYRVLTGEWIDARARAFARGLNRAQWGEISEDERERLVALVRPAYEAHWRGAWSELARVCGVRVSDLDERRRAIVEQVRARREAVLASRRESELASYRERGVTPTPEQIAGIERRISGPITEEQSAHVVLERVPDAVALACLALEAGQVSLEPLGGSSQAAVRVGGGEASRSNRVDLVDAIPGLVVRDAGDREYPLDTMRVRIDRSTFPGPLRREGHVEVSVEGVGAHVLGWMRSRVFAEDVQRRAEALSASPELAEEALIRTGDVVIDRGEYREGDRVGHVGVESAMEATLRGLRGVRFTAVDTGESRTVEARAGRDVTLTLDAALQARVQAVMSPESGLAVTQTWHGPPNDLMPVGTALNGAAVVLDIDTGELLALVSTPGLSRRALREQPEMVLEDSWNVPLVNRPIERVYPPGSIVKPLILAWAAHRGVYRPGQTIECTGHLLPDRPDLLRCWIYKRGGGTHTRVLGRELTGTDGIMVSCNIFFFTLGRRLGTSGMIEAYRAFGVGEGWDLGAGVESRGLLGLGGGGASAGISTGDAIQMGIGQGPVAWTPLHAADAYATLARHGIRVRPTLIAGRRGAEPASLPLPTWAVEEAMQGLALAVGDSRGTGHHLTIDGAREPIFNAAGVSLWGKTGTAAARRALSVPDGEGTDGPTVVDMDHSWFVVLAGRKGDRPRYVISVVMEYAGSGGRVSGPIVNQIIHALIAEGYL